MAGAGEPVLVAIDWGTTSARAYLVGARGETVATRAAQLGIREVGDRDFAGALSQLLGDWGRLEIPRIAGGMIGSRQGWVEASYLTCPASLDALAAGLVRTPAGELAIVPGLIARDEAGVPDVMRGEETQLAGAVDASEGPLLAVLPGTHSKWAHVDRGRVVTFRTSMTGELFAALLDHTILGALADRRDGAVASETAFGRGVDRARPAREAGLAHLVFSARTLALTGELAGPDVAEFLSGVLIGAEIESARGWAERRGLEARRVRLIGDDRLVARYRAAFARADILATPGRPDAAVAGLFAIAQRACLVP